MQQAIFLLHFSLENFRKNLKNGSTALLNLSTKNFVSLVTL